jgi:hypothetical protein
MALSQTAKTLISVFRFRLFFGSLVLGHRVPVTVMGKHAFLDQVQRAKAGVTTALVVSA